jgi:hypothetical protein
MNSHQNNLAATPSFLTMSFDMVTVCVGKADESVDIPVNLQVLTATSPYSRGAFEGDFKEATERIVILNDVTEQTFRIFLQWTHAQLFSSGSTVLVLPRTILGWTASEKSEEYEEHDEDSKTSSIHSDGWCHCSFCSPSHDCSGMVLLIDELDMTSGDYQCKDTYFDDEHWQKNYEMSQLSFLNLFIFADKYSVHQLRDDILTALVSQAKHWRYFPDIKQNLLTTAYDNLPDSATDHKFMVHSAAHVWATEPDADLAARLRSLRNRQPDFAFEVSLAQAQILQKTYADHGYNSYNECHENSCRYHEHLVHENDACRKHVAEKAHVFTVLIDACAKDGVLMAKEHDGNVDLASFSGLHISSQADL